MFEALTRLEKSSAIENVSTTDTKPSLNRSKSTLVTHHRLSAMESIDRRIAASARLSSTLARMNRAQSDFQDLRRLRNIVSQNGLNRSLMKFACPNERGLHDLIPSLPSVESFDSVVVVPSDDRVRSAVEGFNQTLSAEPSLVSSWIRIACENLDAFLTSVEPELKILGQSISHYLVELESANVPEDKIAELKVTAVPYEMLLNCIDKYLGILPDLDAKVSDPTNRDDMDDCDAAMDSRVDAVGDEAGMAKKGSLITATGETSCKTETGTLTELGYTCENIITLLKKADNLVDEVLGLVGRKDAVVGQITTAATLVTEVDNDVPPAVEDAIPGVDDDQDDDEDDGVVTQAAVIYTQVSSNTCSINVIVDASMQAVRNVLQVARAFDQLDNSDVVDMGELDKLTQDPDTGE